MLVACGDNSSSPSGSNTPESTEKGTRDNASVVILPEASGVTVHSCDSATVDVSNISEGYIMADYFGTNNKVKLRVTGPDGVTYTYDLHGGYEVFPITAGNGSYTIGVYENISET